MFDGEGQLLARDQLTFKQHLTEGTAGACHLGTYDRRLDGTERKRTEFDGHLGIPALVRLKKPVGTLMYRAEPAPSSRGRQLIGILGWLKATEESRPARSRRSVQKRHSQKYMMRHFRALWTSRIEK